MFAFLDFAFQYACTLRFVKTCDFQYLRRVQPRIGAPPHHRDTFAHPTRVMLLAERGKARRKGQNLHLIDRDAAVGRLRYHVERVSLPA